ncbi:RING/U-box superfamily protein, putative isoform 1 [Hibiscus syriacus]|uniref:RING/U-box superfamily protein, putative isoform 1 n=1 Tax=Hibiscus syriacus TaxID=106335 RepID=A0A6A2Y419_HIBSY|nr:RING/U-box superfamily protein, putative isoform 1 [Hibiscus syriacus]
MDVDWDLHAVVRGCATVTTRGSGGAADSSFMADLHPQSGFSTLSSQEPFQGQILSFPNQFEAINDMEELHELHKPFFPKSQPLPSQMKLKQQQEHKPKQSQAVSLTSVDTKASSTCRTHSSHNSRCKRRKNQLKRVCQIPAEGLCSDVWAWRKYGQKPVKGSPYPRGYYKCSSSKRHPAPTNRNSLSGSTRQKPFVPQTDAAGDSIKPSSDKPANSSSPATSVYLDERVVVQSKKVDNIEDLVEDERNDEFGMDTAVSDDFFEGLEGIAEMVAGDCCSDNFPASFDLSLIANRAATVAGRV